MKICLTVNSSPWSRFKGGGQWAVHHLACALCRKGHEVHVVYSKNLGEVIHPEVPYRIHWAQHFNFATVNLNIFSYALVLSRLARRERFEVIHGNAEEAFFGKGIARLTGGKYFFTSHAPSIPSTGMLEGMLHPIQFLKRVNTHLLRHAAEKAKTIITFSKFSQSLVVNGLGPKWQDRVVVIPPGVDPSWFEVVIDPDASADILFWGRVEEEKGLPDLFRALTGVIRNHPDLKLHIVGEGNKLTDCKRLVMNLGLMDHVWFHGWLGTEAIQQLAAKCRAGVFPSRIESFGLSVAESMAAGLPVIATRAEAIPETVEDGVTGTLVGPGDIAGLAGAIRHALDHPEVYRERAELGREASRRRFSWDTHADEVIRLYEGG